MRVVARLNCHDDPLLLLEMIAATRAASRQQIWIGGRGDGGTSAPNIWVLIAGMYAFK
jgi:hypothetical protein